MGELMIGLYVFVLATLAGREVITKVPPTLHTPLMPPPLLLLPLPLLIVVILVILATAVLDK